MINAASYTVRLRILGATHLEQSAEDIQVIFDAGNFQLLDDCYEVRMELPAGCMVHAKNILWGMAAKEGWSYYNSTNVIDIWNAETACWEPYG